MKKLSLNGAWTLEIPGSAFGPVPAQVPGSVYHDLLTAGCIPDPFWRDNENDALKLMENDFVYTRRFAADAAMLASDEYMAGSVVQAATLRDAVTMAAAQQSTIALIAAQQAAMCAIIAASVSTSAASHSN